MIRQFFEKRRLKLYREVCYNTLRISKRKSGASYDALTRCRKTVLFAGPSPDIPKIKTQNKIVEREEFSMFVYRCVAERLNHPEMGNYDTFGIVADEVIEGKTMGRALAAVEDVSVDSAFVEQLARKCTELQLEPSQLQDVIEDALI